MERHQIRTVRSSPAARIIVSGGRGMGSGDNFKILEATCGQAGMRQSAPPAPLSMRASCPTITKSARPAKSSRQTSISQSAFPGAIQHLAGMKDSKVIVAINKDAEAPIFQVADYGLVADLFQAVPELVKELEKS